ncbi:MAG: ATP-binding cassette domain-containing protein [Clostridia bacterium]
MIKLINIKKKINNKIILDNINLEFTEGKIYGIKGKNGSGKSMLLKTILGISKPTKGKVLVEDIDIYNKNRFLTSCGVLIENTNFFENFSGYENLLMLSKIKNKISKEQIIEQLKKYDLFESKDKKISEYSQGMRQKIGIIQAIMEDEKYILLDEVFNYLDRDSIALVKQNLNEIKQNKIIIITSHIPSDFDNITDEMIEIKNGQIVEERGVSNE